MIPLYGSEKRLCDGFTRRDVLQIGGLGAFGLTADLFTRLGSVQATEAPLASRFGRAKSCILLFLFGSRSSDKPPLSGPYAAFLGRAHDPVWTAYDGQPTRVVPKLNANQTFDVRDHFAGVEASGRFGLAATRQTDVAPERFESRRSLLAQFDATREWLKGHTEVVLSTASFSMATLFHD